MVQYPGSLIEPLLVRRNLGHPGGGWIDAQAMIQ